MQTSTGDPTLWHFGNPKTEMKYLLSLLILLVCLAPPNMATAQNVEVSGTGGYGHVAGEDVRDQNIPLVGISASARLAGPEIKVDYEYINWNRSGGNLHMIGFGWLIQSRRPTVRPFFQFGWTFGIARSHFEGLLPSPRPGEPPRFVSVTDTDKFQGLSLSAGVTFPMQGRFFLRPEFRWRMIGPGPDDVSLADAQCRFTVLV